MKLKSILFIFLCAFSLMFSSLKANDCQIVYGAILEDYLANMEQELMPCSTKAVIKDGLLFYEIGDCRLVDVSSIRSLQQRTNDLLSKITSGGECPYKSMLQEFTTRAGVLMEELMKLEREKITASSVMQETMDVEVSNVLTQVISIVQEGKIRIEMIKGAERL